MKQLGLFEGSGFNIPVDGGDLYINYTGYEDWDLECSISYYDPGRGTVGFRVHNGAWDGVLHIMNDMIYIEATGKWLKVIKWSTER